VHALPRLPRNAITRQFDTNGSAFHAGVRALNLARVYEVAMLPAESCGYPVPVIAAAVVMSYVFRTALRNELSRHRAAIMDQAAFARQQPIC
jgi:hypothetical protein